MKFRYILKKLINEDARFDTIYDKFVNVGGQPSPDGKKELKVSFEQLKQLMKTDPTTKVPENFNWKKAKKEDFKNVITGQYINWLLRTFLKPSDFVSDYEKGTPEYDESFKHYQDEIFEDEDMIKGLLAKFHKFQKRIAEDKRNILNVKGIQELMNLPVRATAGGETVPLREFEGKLVSKAFDKEESTSPDSPRVRFSYPGSEILKVGGEYTLVRIPAGGELGQKAASHFGGYYLGSSNPSSNETNWCTSPDNSHNFRNYIQQAPLYIILANDDKGQVGTKSTLPKERYQIHFGNSRQFKDRLNGNIPNFIDELAKGKFSEFKEFFRDELIKGVGSSSFGTNSGNLPGEIIIKLNNPNPGATSDYIKVFGREGIEEDNPTEKLKEQIQKVPKDCSALTIKNDTRENLFIDIPDEILNLTNLKTINITNIAKSLPNDISPLKNLRFVSIVDNPQLTKLPNGFDQCPNLVFINLKGSDNVVISPEQLEYLEQDKDEDGRIEEPYFWTPK
jgi:hypothetical protein